MQIRLEDPAQQDIAQLLREHLEDMATHSPPESVHALDLPALQADNISFYAARARAPEKDKDTRTSKHKEPGSDLMGCAALKTLTDGNGELKSMRTVRAHLRKGVAATLLTHIINEARARGMQRLSLETGTPEAFAPARELYERFGFEVCPPFGDYQLDPYSLCMQLDLTA